MNDRSELARLIIRLGRPESPEQYNGLRYHLSMMTTRTDITEDAIRDAYAYLDALVNREEWLFRLDERIKQLESRLDQAQAREAER